MKKNLRIVSAAAAALLAVAPVAATAMPVNAETTDYTNISLGGQNVSDTQNQVDVTPSIVLNGNVKNAKGDIVSKASLNGSVSATFGGKSYTANLRGDDQNNVKINGVTAKDALANINAGSKNVVTISNVGFNFGSENKGKKITIASSNKNVTFGSDNAKTITVTLDQNGTAQGLTVNIKDVAAFDATNTNGVEFYSVATGTPATTGNAVVLANTQGQLNVAAIVPAIESNYVAIQRNNAANGNGNGSFSFTSVDQLAIEAASSIKDQLKDQKIDVDANGFFKAPHTFTVKVKATSQANGKSAELPVTVTVANVEKATEPSVAKDVMHAAYFYGKDGKRVGSDKAATYSSLNLVTENNELKKFTISGKTYYKVANEDKYVAAGNITGTSRTLKKNAYVYATSKKRVAAKTTYKKGQSVTTYGAAVKLKNGKAYYRVGKTEYVKKVNF